MGIFRTSSEVTQAIDPKQMTGGCCTGGQCSKPNDEDIREIAYFRWLTATGGSPVSPEESQRFWFEAEAEANDKK